MSENVQHLQEDVTYRAGKIPLHEYIELNAKEAPNQIAFYFYGKSFTWQGLNDYISRLANFFTKMNIQKGDRIALYLQNSPQYVIGYYAIQRIGAIVVPLNPQLKALELAYLFQEGEINSVMTSQDLYPRIEEIKDEAEISLTVLTNYSDFLPEEPALHFPEAFLFEKEHYAQTYDFMEILLHTEPIETFAAIQMAEDTALLVFTSGTTGRPKGAMLTHENTLYKTASVAQANQFTNGDRLLSVAPFSHIAGMLIGVNIAVYSLLESHILIAFDPNTVADAIETYQITTWYSIAIMNAAVLMLPNINERNLSSLKVNMATSFGVAVTEDLAVKWSKVTDGCKLFEAAYGLSESHTGDTFMPQHKIKYGSCGVPVYGTEIKIVDESGETVETGEQGEILITGPGVFKGYFRRKEETEEVLQEGWLHTGDIGKLDEDGYLYYLGRTKELIKSAGYSVFPEDVEAFLHQHEAIRQSVVIGVPDPTYGESVKAFVVLQEEYKNKIKEIDIIAWAKENMAAYKYPRFVEFIEQLPTTSTGKVLRRLLKDK